MLIGSRLLYAVIAIALFADAGPLWLLAVLRMLQGVTAGAYVPALRAALTDLSAPGERGQRFAQLQACEMVGLLLGPALGGAAALWRYSAAFGVAGAAVLVGLLPTLRVPETRGAASTQPGAPLRWWRMRGILVPALGMLAVGTVFSMYDVVWPQYLRARGNNAFVIGLSISLFAVPIIALARPGGRLSDRADRRRLVAAAMVATAACCATYPALRSLAAILTLGTAEAVAYVFLEPTLYAVIGDSSPEHARGRAMGVGGFFEFAGGGFGAAVLGSLYGLREGVPFWCGAAVLVAAALLCASMLPRQRGMRRVVAEPAPTLPVREGEPV
jgi:MFS family permease